MPVAALVPPDKWCIHISAVAHLHAAALVERGPERLPITAQVCGETLRVYCELRTGAAPIAAGQLARELAPLTGANRMARKPGTRPFAERIVRDLLALGEPVEQCLRRQAAQPLVVRTRCPVTHGRLCVIASQPIVKIYSDTNPALRSILSLDTA